MYKTKRALGLQILIAMLVASAAHAQQFYVSPDGSASGNGSLQSPFRTLEQAWQNAKEHIGQQPVEIIFRPGVYYLKETFMLGPEDSGFQDAPVVFCSEEEDGAIISGALRLEGLRWEAAGNGIYMTPVPREYITDNTFDQLFVNGAQQRMARYPNHPPRGYVFGGVEEYDTILKRAKTNGQSEPSTGFVHAIHSNGQGSCHYRIKDWDAEGFVFELQGGWQQNRRSDFNHLFVMVENIREELDAPGEWFLDRGNTILYYIPAEGIDMNTAVVETPALDELFHVVARENAPVSFVRFEGFEFRHLNQVFMDEFERLLRGDWSIVRKAAVFFEGAENCALNDCLFNELGGNGVFFSNYNRGCRVSGCRFERLGESGVCFVGNYACT